jgi:hypothetical protein
MVSLSRFNRGVLILGSLVVPLVGIIAGTYYIGRPERPGDILGPLCIILGISCLVIWRSVPSLM